MQDGIEVVQGILEALNRGDLDAMLARMHPDFEWRPLESSPVARVYRGHAEVRAYVEDWRGTFESVRLELIQPVQDGNHVIAEVLGRGRGRGSGLELESRFWQVWTIRDGLAAAMEERTAYSYGA